MDQTKNTPPRLTRSALLLLAACGAVQAAAACGRVQHDDTGSETHWLVRCDADAECGEGSCECGVCSQPCETLGDCSLLGVSGAECAPAPAACGDSYGSQGGAAPAAQLGVCLLLCSRDADCSGLGAGASCRSQRCELPSGSLTTDGSGGSSGDTSGGGSSGTAQGGASTTSLGGSTSELEVPTLCDGSNDVRLTYVVAGGFVSPFYAFLSDAYGFGSFVIDGQCRFWETRAGDGWVYTGTLEPAEAQEFARALGYGHLSDYSDFVGSPCPDGGVGSLVAPEGRIQCYCGCANDPAAPEGFRLAFRAVDERRTALFAAGQSVTGSARMVLLHLADDPRELVRDAWPLERAPAASEIVENDNAFSLTPTSGVLIDDPVELGALRTLRADSAARRQGEAPLWVSWLDPDGQSEQLYDVLLRDEVPDNVRAALTAAQGP